MLKDTTMNNFEFSPLYILSLLFVIIIVSILMRKAPQLNLFVVIVIGLLSGYVFLLVSTTIFPHLQNTLMHWRQFMNHTYYEQTHETGYIYVYPPLLAVFVLFIVLLYNRTIE
jgi:flagellar biosynthesis protein FliR